MTTTRETLEARLEGIHILYERGVRPEYLYGYARTGNIVTPLDRHRFGIILPAWDAALREFARQHRGPVDRHEVLLECVVWLETQLRRMSPDIARQTTNYVSDLVAAVADRTRKL